MIVGFDLGGGGQRLFDGEHLRVEDDGTFELWRLVESPIVGRFAGRLGSATIESLASLAAAVPAGAVVTPLPPGAHAQRWATAAATLEIPAGHTPDGPWGALLTAARAQLVLMSKHPVAAVELTVAKTWRTATLLQRGKEALPVEPAGVSVDVAAWEGYYDPVGTWGSRSVDLGTSRLDPGWKREIALDHTFKPGPGRVLHVKVGFDVPVGNARTRLVATVAPEMVETAGN